MAVKYAVFVIARNEALNIEGTIRSIRDQSVNLDYLVVVNDGSTDETADILNSLRCNYITLPYHLESYAGRPELAEVCNAGLRAIKRVRAPDYVLQMGGDHILPRDYIENLLSRMEPNVKMASGTYIGARLNRDVPLGSGRLIDAQIWRQINGMVYPVKYGYESWLIYRMRSMGYEVKRYDDVRTITRGIRMNPRKAVAWGKSTYALGGGIPFAVVKALGMGVDGLHFLKGYFSRVGVDQHQDIAGYVRKQQYSRLSARLWEIPINVKRA